VKSTFNPLIEDYTQIFYMIDKGDNRSIQCKIASEGQVSEKADCLSFIFIDFYVPALTPRLNNTETSLQLSENITVFVVCRIISKEA
jgi:hypothetical protein